MLQQWQYMTQIVEARRLQEELDELGYAGWELITAHWEEYSYGGRTQQQARCILKRPLERADHQAGHIFLGASGPGQGLILLQTFTDQNREAGRLATLSGKRWTGTC